MPLAKLTLSVDPALVKVAKRLAMERGTSLSAMFSRLLRAIDHNASTAPRSTPAPLTASVTGLVALPDGRSDAELLTEALAERYYGNGA